MYIHSTLFLLKLKYAPSLLLAPIGALQRRTALERAGLSGSGGFGPAGGVRLGTDAHETLLGRLAFPDEAGEAGGAASPQEARSESTDYETSEFKYFICAHTCF